jgi:tetratricopeptide (TPR) repeat protein
VKCSRCGVESEIEQAFVVRRRWLGLVKRIYCPACWEKVFLRDQLFSLAAVLLLVFLLDALHFGRGPYRALLDFLFLAAIYISLMVAHELAHTAAGLLLGVRVFRVIFGYGKTLWTGRAFGIAWEWHLWPVGAGTLMAVPPQRGSRWRLFGAILAGPALHALLLAAAFALQLFLSILQGWFGVDVALLIRAVGFFLFVDLMMLIFNAVPMKAGATFGRAGTDGLQLIHQALLKPEEQALQEQSYYVMEALDAGLRNDPEAVRHWVEEGLARFPGQTVLRASLGVNLIRQKRFPEAREVFAALIPSEEAKRPFFKYLMYNNAAYADLLTRDPALLPEADRYSAEAYRQLPWEPSVIGTRGAVLAGMGRLEEGIALLREALRKQKEDSGKAADAYHLAAAEGRRGNAEESRRYFALARRYDPKSYLFELDGENAGTG